MLVPLAVLGRDLMADQVVHDRCCKRLWQPQLLLRLREKEPVERVLVEKVEQEQAWQEQEDLQLELGSQGDDLDFEILLEMVVFE